MTFRVRHLKDSVDHLCSLGVRDIAACYGFNSRPQPAHLSNKHVDAFIRRLLREFVSQPCCLSSDSGVANV